jgi:CRISPR-associated endonuclease/helicase Cas3
VIVGSLIAFDDAFEKLSGYQPMAWQRRLYLRFIERRVPDALDLPTGLGKTSVMTIWVIASAQAGRDGGLPRRLVYVVERRVVVDQATSEAEQIATRLAHASDPVIRDLCERLAV